MLILRTLLFGPAHGHEIAKHIQRTTEDLLQVEHGSLYPALHRLERKRWVVPKWETAKDRNREFKYYRLTPAGREQLLAEESKWKQLSGAIARIMWPLRTAVIRWWWRKDREQDLEREIHSDLELEAEEQQENGLSPEEARYAGHSAARHS